MVVGLWLIFVAIFAVGSAERGETCTTPDGKTGTCVTFFTCEAIFNSLSSKQSSTREFATESMCGNDGETLVCCASPGSVNFDDYETTALPDKKSCGVMRETDRILGGTITKIDEFPWVAGLEYRSTSPPFDNVGFLCVGSLISSKYVLTAATCLSNPKFELISVWLGDWQISTDPDCIGSSTTQECADPVQKLKVKKMISHIFYSNRHSSNDIGLIELEKDIKFTDFVQPICLPSPNLKSPEVGARLIASGWGRTENLSFSDYKLKVDLPVVDYDACFETYKHHRNVSSHQICAGGEVGKDTCRGDSGGPLMRSYEDESTKQLRWYQEGIASWGAGCGRGGFPGVYTRVSSYMKWITGVISEE